MEVDINFWIQYTPWCYGNIPKVFVWRSKEGHDRAK